MSDSVTENILDTSFISNISKEDNEINELSISDLNSSFESNVNFDETMLSSSFERFVDSIGDMLSKSQYVLYDLNGNKLCLEKHEVVYESDKDGNRQYYLISDDSPLFQNIDMISKYIENHTK
jgi:hypothetical protein